MNEIAAIKARLARAVMTLQALPSNARERPSGYICGWPEMIRKSKTGAILRRGDMKFNPSNQDISDCYRIIDALYDMSELQRRLLFARAADEALDSKWAKQVGRRADEIADGFRKAAKSAP